MTAKCTLHARRRMQRKMARGGLRGQDADCWPELNFVRAMVDSLRNVFWRYTRTWGKARARNVTRRDEYQSQSALDLAHKILRCSWRLGWHITTSSNGTSRSYWGGGVTPKTSSNYLRGDWIETNVTDTSDQGVTSSRLARIICGMQISNIRHLQGNSLNIPDHTWETVQNKRKDTVYFLLVRYAQPHRYSGRRRGPEHRPLCPGVLEDTHCLWSWAQKVRMRRGCLQGRSWERNKHFFGPTVQEQNLRKESEKHAWYDLVQTSEIVSYANVQYDPDRDNPSLLQSVMWC